MIVRRISILALIGLAIGMTGGCKSSKNGSGSGSESTKPFSLAWSEYPSWSVFGVAHEVGLIHKDAGKRGKIEDHWNIDIVLNQLSYDGCLTAYASGTTDGVCITNMDILGPSLGRKSVAVLPTSTSDGADACIVTGIASVDELAGVDSRGLEKSVSQYMFERNLEILGKDPKKFPFKMMDPEEAAKAMQQRQTEIKSIVVWNPFLMQTLRDRKDAKVLFDSTTIPEEIIDMIVIGKDSLERKGGESFACALIQTFYEVNKLMESSTKGDETLVALGKKFSDLGLEDMKTVVKQTRFYTSPQAAMELFQSPRFRDEIMPKVTDFCAAHEMVASKPNIAFDRSADAHLRFDVTYLRHIESQLQQLANPVPQTEGDVETPDIEVNEENEEATP